MAVPHRLLFLAFVLLAGCNAPTHAPAADPIQEVTRGPTAPAERVWQEGDWIAYDVVAARGWSGHVTAVLDGTAFLADARRWALEEATRDLPILGEIDLATWATTGWGGSWDVLQLPLADGDVWQAKAVLADDYGMPGEVVLDVTASAADIPSVGGITAGLHVEGRERGGGPVRLQAAWDPAIAAPTMWRLLTPSANESWSAMATGAGEGWTGAHWRATARPLVEAYSLVGPTAASRPPVATSFEGPGEPWNVFGQLVAVAVGGAQEVVLTDAAGQAWQASARGLGADVEEVDAAGIPGQWTAASAGAAVVAFGGVFLWAVQADEVSPGPSR